MKDNKINTTSRLLLILGAVGLVAVLYLPMWRIELDAPQYPEGLMLQIHPHGLGGDVEIINGLNHYIGMKTLHSEDFIEFTILPYIIKVLALLFVVVAAVNRRRWLFVLLASFVAFGIVAMTDFWRWEYAYGHDLDPTAAISIPGMAYQPPLIGFKQLLNFGAYSIPDTGGWIFIGVGVLLVLAAFRDWSLKRVKPILTSLILILTLHGCTEIPEPVRISKDQCAFCRMTIEDPRFAAEIVTNKNKVFKFDDVFCVQEFVRTGKLDKQNIQQVYLSDFANDHQLLKAEECSLLQSEALQSPMNGNMAAFGNEADLSQVMKEARGMVLTWEKVFK